jgi:hypothetical protein
MKIVQVIEAKRWLNTKNGRTASIYGSVPYNDESERSDWTIQIVGYTWRLDNGTIGLGRIPAKTKEEAIEVMNRFNNRSA